MMISCALCLVSRVANAAKVKPEYLAVLEDKRNRSQLCQLVAAHKNTYGIPPTYWHLAKTCCEGVTLPSASGESPARQVEEQREPQPTVKRKDPDDVKHRWYSIAKPAGCKRHRCSCKGNCRSGCPARQDAEQGCPNNAVVNLQRQVPVGSTKPVPLCLACKCTSPNCRSGARRPFGVASAISANYGRCRSCWITA